MGILLENKVTLKLRRRKNSAPKMIFYMSQINRTHRGIDMAIFKYNPVFLPGINN